MIKNGSPKSRASVPLRKFRSHCAPTRYAKIECAQSRSTRNGTLPIHQVHEMKLSIFTNTGISRRVRKFKKYIFWGLTRAGMFDKSAEAQRLTLMSL